MANNVRKVDESNLRSVLRLRKALSQSNGLGFSVLATVVKNAEFPFRNRTGYGPRCSGYAKQQYGLVGMFSASFNVSKLSLSSFYAHHTLPTGEAWVNPSALGPCTPMFQTRSAYEAWLSQDGVCFQYSESRRAVAARITREVAACGR